MQPLIDVGRRTFGRDETFPSVLWVVPVVLAVTAAGITARHVSVLVPLLVVALVPWVFTALGRSFPFWLFAVLGLVPVAVAQAVEGLGGSMFLGTTAVCLLASRAAGRGPLLLLTGAAVALPLASLASDRPFDPGIAYFAIGNLFGVVVGLLLGRSRRLAVELRAANSRLRAVAAQEERARLARDVHDLVAHSLTVVVLHVGGARRVLRTDPAAAEEALEQAERTCRESLDGVREVVGLLRAGDPSPSASSDLPQLLETYRRAGVPVELDLDDAVDSLSILVRGTIYRVVQESLANAARYRTPDTPVEGFVAVGRTAVTVAVTNQGGPGRRVGSGGYGLRGLREQVNALGGSIATGPADGQWRVECRLPLDATAGYIGPRTA